MYRYFHSPRVFLAAIIAVALPFQAVQLQGQAIIQTFAGGGSLTFPSTTAALGAPMGAVSGVAADGAGNVYVADPTRHVVTKMSLNGTLTLVAGTGSKGFSGDQAAATSALLNAPQGVAVDQSGNVYIADTGNSRIRKVSTSGIITTVAGSANVGFAGNGGPATSAQLNAPAGVAVDTSGNIYIADTGNNEIRKVNPSGTISAPYTGLSGPRGVAVDFFGNVFIADTGHHKVLGSAAGTVAGNGLPGYSGDNVPGAVSQLNTPTGVAVDQFGNLYIADSQNQRIRMIPKVGTPSTITTIAGNGVAGFFGDGLSATFAELNVPLGVAADPSGNVYIADSANDRVRKADTAGIMSSVAGGGDPFFSGDGGSANLALLNNPSGVSVDSNLNVYIADTGNNRIRQVNPVFLGGFTTIIGGRGPTTGIIFSAMSFPPDIATIAGTGLASYSGDGQPAVAAGVNTPKGVFADIAGNIYIADTGNHAIRKIDANGFITTVAGGVQGYAGDGKPADGASMNSPSSVVADGGGNLFIADTGNHAIRKVTVSGIISTIAGTGKSGFSGDGALATNALLNSPSGIALDSSGNIYIADTQNNRIRKVDHNGNISTVAGGPSSASLSAPTGVAFDASGNLYTVENGGNRIRMMNSSGVISTVAGNGGAGYSGDGALAINAQLNGPFSMAVDSAGNFYIADAANNVIREVPIPAPVASLATFNITFGSTAVGTVSAAQTATLSNTGNAVLAISGIAISGTNAQDFHQTNTCGTSVAAGASCTISVVFAPQAVGTRSAGLTISANVNVIPIALAGTATTSTAPAIVASGVTSAASFQPGLVPGGLVSVFGQNFASTAVGANTSPFPTTLGGVQVKINGNAVPIFFANSTQVNIQAPFELTPGSTASVAVSVNGTSSAVMTVTVNAVQPAIFTLGGSFGNQDAILLANSSTVAMPVTAGITSAPVHVGDIVSIFCTGLGATTPGVSTNTAGPGNPPALASATVTATIGGLPATVSFAGLAPGFIGLYQVNAQVPTGVAAGNAVQVVLTQNGVLSNVATIAVQ